METLIPMVWTVMMFSVLIVATVVFYFVRRLKTQERLKAIEKGVPIPFETVDPRERIARSRGYGIVLIMVGLGFFATFGLISLVKGEWEVFAAGAIGVIPLFIGIGLLIDAHLRRKDLEGSKDTSP